MNTLWTVRERRRQPRVRRGPGRAAAHAARRLPPDGRAAATATASPARRSATWPPTSPARRPASASSRRYAVRRIGGVKIGFIGMTLKGTPRLRVADQLGGPALPRRGADRQQVRARTSSAAACTRSSCSCTRAASRSRRTSASNGCPGLSGPIEYIVRRTTHDVDLFLTGHTHQFYNCVIDGRPRHQRGVLRARDHQGRAGHLAAAAARSSTSRARNWVVGQDVMRAPDIDGADRRATRASRRRSATAWSGASRGAPAARAIRRARARWATSSPTRSAPPPAPPPRS